MSPAPRSTSNASKRMKRLWATPEWREKMREATSQKQREVWATPGYREKMSLTHRRNWNTQPQRRAAFGARSKERWKDPAYRKKVMSALDRARANTWANPKNREDYRQRMLDHHKDPAFVQRLTEGFRRTWDDPKRRAELTAHAAARLRRQGAGRYYYLDRLGRIWFFRSGDEHERGVARWLDAHELLWFYEPCVLGLSDGTSYLPDFWIVEWNTYLEIKGADFRIDKVKAAQAAGHAIRVIHAIDELNA